MPVKASTFILENISLDFLKRLEKGNYEMIEFGNYLLSPEGPKNIAMSIKSRLKGEGGENYFTSTPDELNALLSKLR